MKPLLLVILLSGIYSLSAQSPDFNKYYSRNAFLLEGLGRTATFSLNYERRRVLTQKLKLGTQIGVAPGLKRVRVPLYINLHYGRRVHHAEAGAGIVFQFSSEVTQNHLIYNRWQILRDQTYQVLHLGYRYQPLEGGFFFRIGYTPLIGIAYEQILRNFYKINRPFQHWGSISIGYALKNVNVK